MPADWYNAEARYGPGKLGHTADKFGYFLDHVDLANMDSSFWSMTKKSRPWTHNNDLLSKSFTSACRMPTRSSTSSEERKLASTSAHLGATG